MLRLVSPGNVPICPCSYSYWYPLYSASLGQPGQCTYLSVFVLVLVPLVQCFAWSARAMCLFARVRTRTVRESLHSVYCICTPCTAFPWASAGNVPICPCSYSYWYPFVPLVHASTGNAPTYPRLFSYCTCTVAQYVLYCTSCTMNRRARVRIRTVVVPLYSVPCLYLLYSGLAWLVEVLCLLPVFVLVPCLYYYTVRTGNVCFTRFVLVPCCGCTLAQCVPCLYLLPVFVLVPCVYYCTVGPGCCCCCCFLTLTDPLRIQPWSQDRRNQTKSNRESEMSMESRQKRTDKK